MGDSFNRTIKKDSLKRSMEGNEKSQPGKEKGSEKRVF